MVLTTDGLATDTNIILEEWRNKFDKRYRSMAGMYLFYIIYADDIVRISDTEVNLQYMLDSMHYWCHKWKLKLNIDKSNVMHFSPKRQKRSEFKYHFGNDELINVDKYKYIGIYLDEHITFEHCS